nr:MAG TPA: hypothetical protein [Caudoviricetes sp.]
MIRNGKEHQLKINSPHFIFESPALQMMDRNI